MLELTVRVLVGLGGPYIEVSGRGPDTGNRYVLVYRGQRSGGLEGSASTSDILEDLASELFGIAALLRV